MPEFTRRGLLGATAATALTAGLSPLTAAAKAPMLGTARATHRRIAFGDFEITTLLDGTRAAEDPFKLFGGETADGEVGALLSENNLPPAMGQFTYIPTVVNTGESLVLFDTGNDASGQPDVGNLAARLELAGYTPDQVDLVVLSHLHPDHIGGLMTDGAPTYPNATYATSAAEYDFWAGDGLAGSPLEGLQKLVNETVVPLAEKITFIAPGDSVAPGIEAVDAAGHTPGHMAFHIESAGKRILLTADAANHYVIALQRPDIPFNFDVDKELATTTRRELFGMAAADKIPFIGYHMPFPALGYVTARGDGFAYEAASFQLDI